MTARQMLAGAAAVALVAVTPLATAATAAADSVPFTDRNVVGGLTFCDPNNKAVTSGKVTDIPFAWKVVSSEAAPTVYRGPYQKAHLVVFQPRENVDPGIWSGKQMTASAHYTNAKHPMTQATYGDPALADFVSIAPLWQGLVQVRMYLTNIDTPPRTNPYAAAVIKVEGNNWRVVQNGGPTTSCGVGSAVSAESELLPTSALPSASPTYNNGTSTPSASVYGTPSTSASSSDVQGSPSPADASTDIALPSTANSGPGTVLFILGAVALAVVAGVVGAVLGSRRRPAP